MKNTLTSPWDVVEQDFPRSGSPAEKLRFALQYAVLAPSGHNTQPWLFRVAHDTVSLFADRTRALPVIDPDDRELLMSCGAALFHLRTALRHFGYEARVRTFPDYDEPDLLATVTLGAETEPVLEDQQLFMAIKRRHTNRLPFRPVPVPDHDLEALVAAARAEGADLVLLRDPTAKQDLADLISQGDYIQGSDRSFRRELAAWLHPNHSHTHDGLPGYAVGIGDLRSYAGPFVLRTFDWGRGRAARDRQLAEGSPALAVLTTPADNAAAWLDAGQALDRVLLLAADAGLAASFLNQPVEVPALRPRVATLIERTGYPQIILRLGYGRPVAPTPRRSVNEVMARARYA